MLYRYILFELDYNYYTAMQIGFLSMDEDPLDSFLIPDGESAQWPDVVVKDRFKTGGHSLQSNPRQQTDWETSFPRNQIRAPS